MVHQFSSKLAWFCPGSTHLIRHLLGLALIPMGWLSLQQTAVAQDNQFLANRRNIIPGGRAAQLGGAYTALSDDPSGLFYNPAGMVFGRGIDLSLSANTYFEKKISFKGAVNGKDFTERSTGFFPSFLGSHLKLGSVSLGWALVTLDSSSFNQNDRFENISTDSSQADDFNITHQQASSMIMVATGAGLRLGRSWSIGLTIMGYRRNIEASNHQLVTFNDGSIFVIDKKIDTENLGTAALVGLQWKLDEFSLGFTFQDHRSIDDKTVISSDALSVQAVEAGYEPNLATVIGTNAFFDELNPKIFKLGLAWTQSNFILSQDTIFYKGITRKIDDQTGVTLVNTFDASLGGELKLGQWYLRTGVFTNNSLFPEVIQGGVNQADHVDYLGFSFGLGMKTKDSISSLGIVQQKGTGKSQKVDNNTSIQEVEAISFLVMLSSNYQF